MTWRQKIEYWLRKMDSAIDSTWMVTEHTGLGTGATIAEQNVEVGSIPNYFDFTCDFTRDFTRDSA